MKRLIIITGTTSGLGKSLEKLLSDNSENYIIAINRTTRVTKKLNVVDLIFDLSESSYKSLEEFSILLRDITKSKQLEQILFINNAFSINPLEKIHNLKNNDIIDSYYTNVLSPIMLIKEFIKIVIKIKIEKKAIINISSGAAKKAIEGWSTYCCTKSAMEMFVRSINIEYKDINAVSIDPGVIDTGMQLEIRKYHKDINNYFVKLKENNLLLNSDEVAYQIISDFI